jgi:hypothetical protein
MQLRLNRGDCVRLAILLATAAAPYSTLVAADKSDAKGDTNHGLPPLLDEDFSKGADRWEPISPEGWKIIDENGQKLLSQFKIIDATKKLPHRSPWGIAFLKDMTLGDFVLEVKLRETADEKAHRDCCLAFDYKDPAHFYYIHFSPAKNDPHADQVFIVNDADRLAITDKDHQSPGVNWGAKDAWHRLKIVRKVDDGLIEAYFDDMEKPIMTAHDKTFKSGRIGIGTFDDTADFAEVKIWGNKAKPALNEGIDSPGISARTPPK